MELNPQCASCKHVLPGMKCAAFPLGIPREIALNKFDHKNPYPGDRGIRWEEAKTGWPHAIGK